MRLMDDSRMIDTIGYRCATQALDTIGYRCTALAVARTHLRQALLGLVFQVLSFFVRRRRGRQIEQTVRV